MNLAWIDLSTDDRIIHYAAVGDGCYYVVLSQPSEGFAAFFLTPDDFSALRNQTTIDEAKTACATHADMGDWTRREPYPEPAEGDSLEEHRRRVRKWMVQGAREYFCNHPAERKAVVEALAGKPLGGSFIGFEAETRDMADIARAAVLRVEAESA